MADEKDSIFFGQPQAINVNKTHSTYGGIMKQHLICVFYLFLFFASGTLLMAQIPIPFINQPLMPMTVAPGSTGLTLTLNGTGFMPGSVVNWNGNPLVTTYVSASRLTAAVPAPNVANPLTAFVTVVNPGAPKSNVAYFQVSEPIVSDFTTFAYLEGTPLIYGTTTADFNNDGKLDLLAAMEVPIYFATAYSSTVLLGKGGGTFQVLPSAIGGKFAALGDFNDDGKPDLFVAQFTDEYPSNYYQTLLGNGDGTFQNPVYTSTLGVGYPTFAGDFNGDGKLDVASSASPSGNGFSILLGNGDGTFQGPITTVLNLLVLCGASAGDFDGDGKLDVVVCSTNNSGIGVALGNGDGTFQAPTALAGLSFDSTDVEIADLNGDGKLDLVAIDVAGSVAVLLGNGDGTFATAVTYPAGVNFLSTALIGDFNADGKLDIVLPTGFGPNILFGNGDGTFGTVQSFSASADPTSTGDFNQDGIPDLAGVLTGGPTGVAVLLQHLPTLQPSPSKVDFGALVVDSASSPQPITLHNTGQTPVNISSIRAGGDFSQTNNCGSALAVGASCTLNAIFRPTASGVRNNFVTIADNGPGGSLQIPLTGNGSDFTIIPNGATSVTVTPGQAANYTIDVGSDFGFGQTVALTCAGVPESTCSVTPNAIAVPVTGPSATAHVAVVTTGSAMASLRGVARSTRVGLALAVLGLAVLPTGIGRRCKGYRRVFSILGMVCLVSVLWTLPACGGSGASGGGTPLGTYQVTVTGTFSSGTTRLVHSTNFTLVVQ